MGLRASLLVVLLTPLLHTTAVSAQPGLQPVDKTANTEMPVTLPGGTEVLEAERTGVSSRAARLPLEGPINPDEYICGSGDSFEVAFWGKQNFRLQVTVDLEGRAFISKVGYVKVSGHTLTDVRHLITGRVRREYPGLKVELTLSEPRAFLVHAVEYVAHPGQYTTNPLERVSSVLQRAGGVTGSERKIEIHRRDGSRLAADLLQYRLTGDTKYNPYVLDGDVIRVPYPELVVTVSGPIQRPGSYELVGTKDITELLELAGGFTTTLTRKLPMRLVRRNNHERRAFIDLPFAGTGATPNLPLQDGDEIQVRSTDELQRSVLLIGPVEGAQQMDPVTASRRLPYVEGDTVRTIIDRAGGVTAPADLRRAYISRPRTSGKPDLISIDLEAILVRRDYSTDKPVQMGDSIVIPTLRRSVLVEGAVTRAGTYDYNPRFGVPEYLANAGGRSRTAQGIGSIRIVDASGKTKRYRRDLPVEAGDMILVPERDFTRAEIVQLVLAGAGLVLSGVAVTIAATR